jgi:hypothetical protein
MAARTAGSAGVGGGLGFFARGRCTPASRPSPPSRAGADIHRRGCARPAGRWRADPRTPRSTRWKRRRRRAGPRSRPGRCRPCCRLSRCEGRGSGSGARATPGAASRRSGRRRCGGCHAVASLPRVLGRQHERAEVWPGSEVGRLETDAGGLADEAIGQAIEMRTSVPPQQRNTSSDQRVKLVD